MDAEETYYKLREFAESLGEVGDFTDGLLGKAAEALANDNNDPREN